MRLGRRAWLALAGAGGLGAVLLGRGVLAWAPGDLHGPTAIAIDAEPIRSFAPAEPDRTRFGALAFRSGLVLSSPHRAFGGLSGLWRSRDGGRLVAVSDNAAWLDASIRRDGPALAGLADARLSPILGPDGVPLAWGPGYDTEGLAIAGGEAFVCVERIHAVMRFDWGREGHMARASALPMPPATGRLATNRSLEAIAVVPGGPLAGAVVAIAEQSRSGDDAPTTGFVLTGPDRGAFEVARSDGFDVTDLAFLPSGEALLLERRFSYAAGVAMRLRRLPAGAIRPGARLDGPVVVEADRDHRIDNMEGLAIHEEDGAVIVTLVSDDNFSALQRTILLEFELVG